MLLISRIFEGRVRPVTMTTKVVRTTKLTIYDDGVPIPEYDGNITDMLDRGLYTRDWELIGTEPPSEISDAYFDMKFVQVMPDESVSSNTNVRVGTPILLRYGDDVLCEQIPIDRRVLDRYYNYFSRHVSRNIGGSLLLNICKDVFKSPVFDIPYCTAALPKRLDYSRESFTAIDTDYGPTILFVPVTITSMIIDSLDGIGIKVVPSPQDTWSHGSCRIRISQHILTCTFERSDWKGSGYAAELSRLIECRAVATAILTVSVLLEPWQYSRGSYTSKYCMTYVVHAVK